MVGLSLLAAHLVGDYLLSTRWQAERKLVDWHARANAAAAYVLPFAPVAFLAGDVGRALIFVSALAVAHFVVDSYRFRSTLGDRLGWLLADPATRRREWAEARRVHGDGVAVRKRISDVAPNPSLQTAFLVDQALHVAVLAALAWIL